MRRDKKSPPQPSDGLHIYGRHAVSAALKNPQRPISRVMATRNAAARHQSELAARGLTPQIVGPRDLERHLGAGAVHQGIAIDAGPLPPAPLEGLLDGTGLLLVLDQVTDPRNVGAILRAAAAFAAKGIIVTRRNQPRETGVLAKAASGGLEHVPICTVTNLARTLDAIKDGGFLVVGLDSDGATTLGDLVHDPKTALVLGAEGAGLRRLTREACDHVARIDLPGAIRSVNVATAAALALQSLHLSAAAASKTN